MWPVAVSMAHGSFISLHTEVERHRTIMSVENKIITCYEGVTWK